MKVNIPSFNHLTNSLNLMDLAVVHNEDGVWGGEGLRDLQEFSNVLLE